MTNHSQVAHVWAAQSGRDAKGYGMFTDGRAVYSWGRHFVIAQFVDTPEGPPVVLFNANGYSSSTAKHKCHVRRAIPSRYRVFTVPDAKPEHESNLLWYVEQAAERMAKAAKARTRGPYLIEEAGTLIAEAIRYAGSFGIDWTPPAMDSIVTEATARREAQQAAYRAEREAREEQERQRQAALREEQAPRFLAWVDGEPGSRVPSMFTVDSNGCAYVRRNGDNLETSQGAAVPWEHAVKAFRFIKLCRETGREFHRNGRTVRVGHFQVDSIDSEGNMRAGCHSFAWREIERLAIREGVFELPADESAVEQTAHA